MGTHRLAMLGLSTIVAGLGRGFRLRLATASSDRAACRKAATMSGRRG